MDRESVWLDESESALFSLSVFAQQLLNFSQKLSLSACTSDELVYNAPRTPANVEFADRHFAPRTRLTSSTTFCSR